jgi:LacI family transcriptional regulator
MASLSDVAREAQVSTATVSHVINDSAYVSPKLRRRVLAAVMSLNYHPNALARGLRTKQTRTVGMIIPDITNPFFPEVVRGAEDILRSEGYSLIVGNSDNHTETEAAYYKTFREKRVDGLLLIIAANDRRPDYLRQHDPRAVPIVFIDRYCRGLPGDSVLADNVKGSAEAVAHLVESGHRRIGIITGPHELVNARMRLEGYERALEQHGIEIDRELIREGRFDIESGYEQAKGLLSLQDPPTAVFVSNGLMTMGCLQAVYESGIRYPDELAIVGFDDLKWFSHTRPQISAVAQPAYDLGATAGDLLLKRISGKLTGPPRRQILGTHLEIRDSSQAHR